MGLVQTARLAAEPRRRPRPDGDDPGDDPGAHECLTDQTQGSAQKTSKEHDSEGGARPLGAALEHRREVAQRLVRRLRARLVRLRVPEPFRELSFEGRRSSVDATPEAIESRSTLHARELRDERSSGGPHGAPNRAQVERREERAPEHDERREHDEEVRDDQNGSE